MRLCLHRYSYRLPSYVCDEFRRPVIAKSGLQPPSLLKMIFRLPHTGFLVCFLHCLTDCFRDHLIQPSLDFKDDLKLAVLTQSAKYRHFYPNLSRPLAQQSA